jgi:uncharacterized protein
LRAQESPATFPALHPFWTGARGGGAQGEAVMMIAGSHTFSGARTVVWELLLDPEVLGKTMAGTAGIRRVAPDRYEGKMGIGLGPVTAGEFDVVITLRDVVEPERYTLDIDGRGTLGVSHGQVQVTLGENGTGTTMHYQADLQMGGKLAALGQGLLDSVSKLLLRQGFEAMSAELERRLQGP